MLTHIWTKIERKENLPRRVFVADEEMETKSDGKLELWNQGLVLRHALYQFKYIQTETE